MSGSPRISLEPINGAESVFPETVTYFAHNVNGKSILILSLQIASLRSGTLCCYLSGQNRK